MVRLRQELFDGTYGSEEALLHTNTKQQGRHRITLSATDFIRTKMVTIGIDKVSYFGVGPEESFD